MCKRFFMALVGILYLFLLATIFPTPSVHGFFDRMLMENPVTVTIGDFPFSPIQEWNPETDYAIGDRFTYNGLLWEIRAGGDYTQPPEGDKLRPWGPYQEVTDEYRSYNTYFQDDIVIHNGLEYLALYNGMSGKEPGTVTGWQALTDEWQYYNIYEKGDIVIHNGIEYEAAHGGLTGVEPGTSSAWKALTDEWQFYNVYLGGDTVIYENHTFTAKWWTQGDVPTENAGQWDVWTLEQFVLEPGLSTHIFYNNVLDATITIDGVVVVEDGVIDVENAASLGLTIEKGQGNFYWSFHFETGSVRIRSNNDTIVYQQDPVFESIIFDLP